MLNDGFHSTWKLKRLENPLQTKFFVIKFYRNNIKIVTTYYIFTAVNVKPNLKYQLLNLILRNIHKFD